MSTTKMIDDAFLYEQLPKIDKQLIEKIESKIDTAILISEDFNQKILNICEKRPKKRVSLKLSKAAAIFIICTLSLFTTGIIVNALSNTGRLHSILEDLITAEIVTDENEDLIGTEIISIDGLAAYKEGTEPETEELPTEYYFSNTQIANSADDEVLIPTAIEDIGTIDGSIPEIILSNASSAIFYQDDFTGWKCDKGDILSFNFTKYETNSGYEQTLIVGYVLDGVMYAGESFRELSGCYQLNIETAGEYYIYVINAASDYLTLKSGQITINKSASSTN